MLSLLAKRQLESAFADKKLVLLMETSSIKASRNGFPMQGFVRKITINCIKSAYPPSRQLVTQPGQISRQQPAMPV